MKLLTCIYQGQETVAVLAANGRHVVPVSDIGYDYATMNDLIRGTDRASLAAMAAPPRRTQTSPSLWRRCG